MYTYIVVNNKLYACLILLQNVESISREFWISFESGIVPRNIFCLNTSMSNIVFLVRAHEYQQNGMVATKHDLRLRGQLYCSLYR